ncbi:MAG: hypothetical protein LUG99_03305 [Lachnospiraceae bacterium]|nr:hypothetical protein [Lachnospiraceae bacterium]
MNSWYLGNLVDFSSACFGNVALFIVSSVSGTMIWCYIAQVLAFMKPLKFIGRNSLVYYGMHFFFTSAIGFLTDNTLIIVLAALSGTTVTVMIYNKLKIYKLFKGRFTL